MKRYDLIEVGHYDDELDHRMCEAEGGEWVRYEDAIKYSLSSERDAERYRRLRAAPWDAMLVFAEATNQDTFGLNRNQEIKDSVRHKYIDNRVDELSSQSASEK